MAWKPSLLAFRSFSGSRPALGAVRDPRFRGVLPLPRRVPCDQHNRANAVERKSVSLRLYACVDVDLSPRPAAVLPPE